MSIHGTAPIDLARRRDGTCVLRLDRGARLNMVDVEMRDSLLECLQLVEQDTDIRALCITASGPHFSAGADLREFCGADDVFHARRVRWERDTWLPLWELRVPAVVSLHGFAVGAGTEMAMLCDFRVAGPDTVMSLPECSLGMLPSAGGTQSLPRTTSIGTAMRLMLTGERVGVDAALELGLVDFVSDDPDQTAQNIATHLASLPPEAVAGVRRAVRSVLDGAARREEHG